MRIKTRFYLYTCLLAAVMLLSGCGPKTRPGEEQKPAKKPYAIIYDTELSGRIFNVPLSDPAGLTSDNNGNIYLIDAGNSRLIKFDRSLEPVRETGGFGTSESLFGAPRYIVMDNNLNLYVADPGNQRISIYDSHLNYVNVLPNKFFDYLIGGLCLAITPLKMMQRIVEASGAGIVASDTSVEALASAISSLTAEGIDTCKQNALDLAKTMNADAEMAKLQAIYQSLLAGAD